MVNYACVLFSNNKLLTIFILKLFVSGIRVGVDISVLCITVNCGMFKWSLYIFMNA